tara:strand:- start:2081 stop:2374 length:294 start_codon:yes stop_codon:yes gene_type:complete
MARMTDAKRIMNIHPEVLEVDDPRLVTCPYCEKSMFLGMGYYGYGAYNLQKYGKKFKCAKSRKHYGSRENPCLKKWLDGLPKRRDVLKSPRTQKQRG